jgi:thioesterase domain-containing protein
VGGYSGGGIVAYEMVRQLQAAGEQVERLVLFDSPLPGEAALPVRTQWIEFARNVRRYGLRRLRPYARWRAQQIIISYVPSLGRRFDRDKDRTNAAREIGAIDVQNSGFVDLFYYFSAAVERYEMRRLHVDLVLVKADRVWPVHAYDYHWSRYVDGRIDIIGSPGDHWAMFFPENAPTLAEVLTSALRNAPR